MVETTLLTTQELLARFKETHPQLDSIRKIAAFGTEQEFVDRFGANLAGKDREARQIYRAAVNLQERSVLLWSNLRDAVSPYLGQTLFNNLPQDLPDAFLNQQASVPGYDRLFGNLDFIDCKHHRSIFGPAAYFVDLMRFVEQQITQKNRGNLPLSCSLEERRPDLARIELDADNSDQLIPYIDLVNELLEAFVKTVGDADSDAYEVLKTEIFPMSLPFDLPLVEIRTYLKQLKTSLHEIYQLFEPLDATQRSVMQPLLTREYLELSSVEYALITRAKPGTDEVSAHFGDVPLDGNAGLENVDVFLAQTGLTRLRLNELLFQDLDRHEVNAGMSRLFFINNTNDGEGHLTIGSGTDDAGVPFERLLGLSAAKLDRIHRFIRLSSKLDWSFADLDWALRSLVTAYRPEATLYFDGINDHVICEASSLFDNAFTLEAWIHPSPAERHVVLSKGNPAGQELHFMLWIDVNDRLSFQAVTAAGPIEMKSVYPIPVDVFTHIALQVTQTSIRFIINGRPDQGDTLSQPLLSAGSELVIGRDLAGDFFSGTIRELRIWGGGRTLDEIDDNRYHRITDNTPGMLGYWPLVETIDGVLTDHSGQENHGRLGGREFVTQPRWVRRDLVLDPSPSTVPAHTPEDFAPQVVPADRPLPAPPVATRNTVLELDGENDVLVIRNEKNRGLGRLDRWTLEFWFKASARKKHVNRKQLLLSQGDAEAGLSIYLWKHQLHIVQWCNNFKQTDLQTSLLSSRPITEDGWHHLAVTHDEFPPGGKPMLLDTIEYRGYLDGSAFQNDDESVAVGAGFHLSPVGVMCMGGLANGMVTCLADGYVPEGREDEHFFAGQVCELRLWRTIRTPEELIRDSRVAPTLSADLLARFAFDEGDGWLVRDRVGVQHHNRYTGTLQKRQIVLESHHEDDELVGIHSCYDTPEALSWSNYTYAGRLRMTTSSDAIGVTFLSRQNEGVDQYYRLARDAEHPAFRLIAYPLQVQNLSPIERESDTAIPMIEPVPELWYRFLVRVEDTGSRTEIRAKIWPEAEEEPAGFQIEAFDDNPDIRITAGSVGVWTTGTSKQLRQFDNLCVWANGTSDPGPDEMWLDTSFESARNVPEPERWTDRADRVKALGDERLFRHLELEDGPGRSVWGTDSSLLNIHSHYHGTDIDISAWQNYRIRGQMRFSNADSGVGVTLMSRYPQGGDQYYSLQRDTLRPAFHLTAHPHGVQPITHLAVPENDSGELMPLPDTWYRFHIQVISEPDTNRTEVRARVWEAGTREPDAFQMVIQDDSSIRLHSGTVGVWASGSGSKYFDELRVDEDWLLAESFETYAADKDPVGWRDTAKHNKLEELPELFKTAVFGENIVFGTHSTGPNVHSHYVGPGVLQWRDYSYTGRLYMADDKAGVGVTFLSRYADETAERGEHDFYYRLRRYPGNPTFHISPHRGNGKTPDKLIKGTADSRINPTADTWYRFHIQVEDTGKRTRIRANVWPESQTEPLGFQIDAFDDADDRLVSGTVGLWAEGPGAKYFDDLQVIGGLFLTGGNESETWIDSASLVTGEPDDSLFKTTDQQDNALRWTTIDDFPLLRHPLVATAWQFDGQRQALTGEFVPAAVLSDLTIEAWVKVASNRINPILELQWDDADDLAGQLDFGVDANGRPTLSLATGTVTGSTPAPLNQFVHVAVRVQGSEVAFLIDGQSEEQTDVVPAKLTSTLDAPFTRLELGRSATLAPEEPSTRTSPEHVHFAGELLELRLWNTALSDLQIAANRFQLPDVNSHDLIGYWSPANDSLDADQVPTAWRIPLAPIIPITISPIGIQLSETGFWRAKRQVLAFNAGQVVTYQDPGDTTDRYQRTIEVYFQIQDKSIARRKQVIYHEGDWQRGLSLYVHDGELYFVGCNSPASESHWSVTDEENWLINPVDRQRIWRLKTNRIESCRWHHAALVLDGRDEVRPTSLRAYVDGKLVATGPGSRLWQHKSDFSLGGVSGSIQFHDALSDDAPSFNVESTGRPGHTLDGHILMVRAWNEACTSAQIENHWSQALVAQDSEVDMPEAEVEVDPGVEATLDLLWNFDNAVDTHIPDSSGKARNGTFDSVEQLRSLRQSLQSKPVYALPPVTLDESTLEQIAAIKRLTDDHRLSIDQVTALWTGARHVGREDHVPLHDRIFNAQVPTALRWHHYLDRPIRWDRTGQENRERDRQIRSRLMQSLQLSSEDLDTLVGRLSDSESVLEIDDAYLQRLYRLARLAKLLRLSVPEFLALLAFMGQHSFETLADVMALSERAAWMQSSGISVSELILFSTPVSTGHARLYDAEALRNFARELLEQSGKVLIRSASFANSDLSEAQSLATFLYMQQEGRIELINAADLVSLSKQQQSMQALAAVRPGAGSVDLTGLLEQLARVDDWQAEFDPLKAELDAIRGGLGQQVRDALIARQLLSVQGQVFRVDADSFNDVNLVQLLPERDRRNQAMLAKRGRMRQWLEQRLARQEQITSTVQTTLENSKLALPEAIRQGLSELFGVSADLVAIVIGYLQDQDLDRQQADTIDTVAFIRQMHSIRLEDAPISPALSIYMASLVKLLYLLSRFGFSEKEAGVFLAHPESVLKPAAVTGPVVTPDLLSPSLPELNRLAHFQRLKAGFADESSRLIGLLGLDAIDLSSLAANDSSVRTLSGLTGWNPQQLVTLAGALDGKHHNQVETLGRMHQVFMLVQSMGSDVEFLIQLSRTARLERDGYRRQSATLLKVLQSTIGEDDWARVYKPIASKLALQKRDALLAMAMKQLPATFAGRRDPDILYEYFLLDMQMGSEVETSRIVQATASLQLYVQRCLMNLEAGVEPSTISLKEWEWVKNYRVWEANRKVFLYPENYIEPELRRSKTPQFEDLEKSMLQVDIDQASVEKAYITYLDAFSELARLKIVGSYLHRDLDGDPVPGNETLYLVARTDTQPRIYHLRRRVKNAQGERWLPWEKIDVAINSDFATPVFAFGKLLMFWTEFTKLMESRDTRLSSSILEKYSTDLLNDVFKSPQITPGDIRFVDAISRIPIIGASNLVIALSFWTSNQASGHFSYLLHALARDPATAMRSLATAQQEVRARKELVAALLSEEITRLERGEWSIDSAGYLFDTRIVGRVQRNVNVFTAAVKYSYHNFGNAWIPPQTLLEEKLSDEDYRQIQWHTLYVQRAYEFNPGSGSQTAQTDKNPDVLQIDEKTQLGVILPRFNMDNNTWSFWVNPANVSLAGHKGSIATDPANPLENRTPVTRESLLQTTILLDYDKGALQIELTNQVTAIQGAQLREDNVRDAVPLTLAAEQRAENNDFIAAASELSRIGQTPVSEITEAQRRTAAAVQARREAVETRTLAVSARAAAASAPQNSPDKPALEAEASRLERLAAEQEQALPAREREAKKAVSAAVKATQQQLLIEVEASKWESKALTLTVRFGISVDSLTTTLTMDAWQHVALKLERSVVNGAEGYQATLIRYSRSDAQTQSTHFFKSTKLAQRELLEFGTQAAATVSFSARMAEFQFWNEARPVTTISAERDQRRRSDAGLFTLPLDEQLPSSSMTLVTSQGLEFSIPIAFEGSLDERLSENRERIIIFYGNKIRSIRNNLEEQIFDLSLDRQSARKLHDVKLQRYHTGNATPEAVLSLTRTDGLFINDFASTDDRSIPALPDSTADTQNFIIRKLVGQEVSFLDVHNRPGWYIADTGDDQYLMKSVFLDSAGNELPVPTATELLQVQFNNAANVSPSGPQAIAISFALQENQAPSVSAAASVEFEFERLSTFAIHQLSQNLFTAGIDGFLKPASQQTPEIDFWKAYAPNETLVPRTRNRIPDSIDFHGSDRLYFEELFFHIPFLIANQLNANQQFADAQKWYHYIFNPTASKLDANNMTGVQANGNLSDRYWQYIPFRGQTAERLLEVLTQPEALTVYREDPFDPHAIAALRLSAYQKAIVMKYIDNLLDWGDSLFAQDTRESITEASLLYVQAFNLLGTRPRARPVRTLQDTGSYNNFVENFADSSEFMTDSEKLPPASGGTAISLSPHAHLITHFCVPENEKFIGYWDQVEDRLYKIRHSLNIEGIFRQLALFQPPIDPSALVRAVAGGGGLSSGLSDLSVSVPHYRYTQVLEQAQGVAEMLGDLGSALLDALEARDEGQLTLLQHGHERNLLDLMTTLKTFELTEAKEEIKALTINRQNVEARQEHYRSLVEDGTAGLSLNAAEAFAITSKNIIRGLKPGIGITSILSSSAKAAPAVEAGASGFGGSPLATVELSGDNIAAAFDAQGAAVGLTADILDIAAEMSQEIGEYQRRMVEWEQEKRTADFDLQEIDQQLVMATHRLQRSQFEQDMHEREMEQHQAVADFYRSKFTNGELRNWTVGRLSGLYFQAYKLAYDVAKAAEKALQFELPTTETFITPGHWDSMRKGLLAGESLLLQLNQMDKVHLDQDSRFQDIEKTISMQRSFPELLDVLKQSGTCELSLSERLFNLDFPGHYCRLLKTIAISIVADGKINPFDAVHASLSQTSNKTLLLPDSDAVAYLMGMGDESPDASTLRVNWRANQQIAISKPAEDLGMFNLDFIFDDRYFPFEGTGAVSTWRLEMPPENNPSLAGNNGQLQINDVIFHLRYTSKFDNGAFRQAVQTLMKA